MECPQTLSSWQLFLPADLLSCAAGPGQQQGSLRKSASEQKPRPLQQEEVPQPLVSLKFKQLSHILCRSLRRRGALQAQPTNLTDAEPSVPQRKAFGWLCTVYRSCWSKQTEVTEQLTLVEPSV